MKLSRRLACAATFLAAVALVASSAWACPFCSAPSLTLSEQVEQNDAVVLVKWADAEKAEGTESGRTTYEVEEVVKAPAGTLKKGSRVTLTQYRAGKEGDLFLLMGTRGSGGIEWSSPLEVTRASFKYVAGAPAPKDPPQKRLAYFLEYLEFPDQLVSNDAYQEFANAPYKDILLIADKLPQKRLRKWIASDETAATRLGLYGLLLGLSGNAQDAKLMEKKIVEPTEDFRLGIDGVIGGYLILTGEKGLDLVDDAKLKNKKAPFSETYAAMQALRFMWTYAPEKIERDRLRESMRILLDRPELADLVIADLARWQDWSVQDRLMELYEAEDYSIPSIKRAIVRYMLACVKDRPKGEAEAELPEHVVQAEKHLAELRKKDPKTVKEAERFFFLQ